MRKLLLTCALSLAAMPIMASDTYRNWVDYSQAIMSLTILFVVLTVGGMALRWTYKHNYRGSATFWAYAFANPLVKLFGFILLVMLFVNLVAPKPHIHDDHAMADFAELRHMPKLAEEANQRLSVRYPYIVRYHFGYISAHYLREGWSSKRGETDLVLGDTKPVMAYSLLGFERDPYLKDISSLGIAMCNFYEYSYDLAMEQLRRIRTPDMPYRNLFMGRVHLMRHEFDSARTSFERELAIGQEKGLAAREILTMLYFNEPDSVGKMRQLIDSPEMMAFVPTFFKRYVHTKEGNLGAYLNAIVSDWWANIQWIGLLGALLGTLVWMLFLRKIDLHNSERWQPMVFVFLAGAVFSFLANIFYDFLQWEYGFYMSNDGAVVHDFFYCVFGIGFVEESVKIIPFLLLMQFSKRVETPLSYIVYASLSALGFAFVENLMYFDAGHIGIMHGRILVCNMFHMFATSTIAFGMMLGRFKYKNLQWPFFILFFLLAALMHGFYDFWILNETVGLLVFMSYGLFIYATFQYAAYLNTALNQIQALRGRQYLDPISIAVFLTVGLVSTLLFEYLGLSFVYGAPLANYSLINSLGMGSFLMFFVVLNLSNIDIVQGEWLWIRTWNFGTRVGYNNAIGRRLKLVSRSDSRLLQGQLPAAGEIIARISLNGDSRFFLFQFDNELDLNGFPLEYVLMRTKLDGEIPEANRAIEADLFAFRDKAALLRSVKRRDDFKMLDRVEIA